jgi:hypothetical protein
MGGKWSTCSFVSGQSDLTKGAFSEDSDDFVLFLNTIHYQLNNSVKEGIRIGIKEDQKLKQFITDPYKSENFEKPFEDFTNQ